MGLLEQVDEGRRHPLCPQQLLGRAACCHVTLKDTAVSAVHAELRWTSTGWELRDLGSRNGTTVDGISLTSGERRILGLGSLVAFGSSRETWRLACAEAPGPRLVALDESTWIPVQSLMALPDESQPLVTLHQVYGTWFVEDSDGTRALRDGDPLSVGGRTLRFEESPVLSETPASCGLGDATNEVALSFRVSRDEERVALSVVHSGGAQVLAPRSFHYLALTLARHRQREMEQHVEDPGWLPIEDLLRMLPEYTTVGHLNVAIHRFRQQVAETPIVNPVQVIERRRGELRIGVRQLRIERRV